MRRLFLPFVTLAVIFAGFVSPGSLNAQTTETAEATTNSGTRLASASRLVWQKDLEMTLEMARRDKKMVLVDVYTDWCGWCHRLDKDTYTNPEVISFVNSQFVCVRLDAEDGGKGAKFAERYRVTAFPCTMVLDASGRRLGGFYGYRSAKQFPDAVRQSLDKQAPIG